MSRREIIAYAITHAPPGVKGGPYEGCGAIGGAVAHLRLALRWSRSSGATARNALAAVRKVVPHARVIRIVRKRPSEASAVEVLRDEILDEIESGARANKSFLAPPHLVARAEATLALVAEVRAYRNMVARPSEASAVEVLRELVAWDNWDAGPAAEYDAILARARVVLAASGPDPMLVVRAAMEETDAEEAEMVHPSAANAGRRMRAREARRLWVGTYRKAGGK